MEVAVGVLNQSMTGEERNELLVIGLLTYYRVSFSRTIKK